jgi:hypothetical protein
MRAVEGVADDDSSASRRLQTVPRYVHLTPEQHARLDALTALAKARRRSETAAQRARRRSAGSTGPLSGSKVVRALIDAQLRDLGDDLAVVNWLLALDAEGQLI